MVDTIIRLAVLIAIFASIFVLSQLVLNSIWARKSHLSTVNRRLRMISEGSTREHIVAVLRKHEGGDFSRYPEWIARRLASLQRSLRAAALPISLRQLLLIMSAGFFVLLAVISLLVAASGFALNVGVFLMIGAIAFCVTIMLPVMILSMIAQRRRSRVEDQFPVSLDVFVRALRAGHPVASAIELLTNEMQDPIGSEFGLVADEVSYGAELTDSLAGMAERWDLEDIRMFVVSLSVQNETGGNLAEILENLADVIRARASLYRKVRALSSEGRMTGWMLSILPVAAFVGLFAVNPAFYLEVAQDRAFIIGFGVLIGMYLIGLLTIRKMVDIKV
ncbi:type II secretion system F family protein [Pontixanthobacter gangjinensis]|uniref:Secretion system protein n=1 Tax=Pontixanthobacter gangjinensis TaxID=1028742 RepID=A0A6I4SIR0_9SPHN|nr:type II secretion system F family protein [Pontixanthobacter gangjinensis]MXO55258.1 secretion system protein [Pontixanthobacter gangjinensis]